MAPDLVVLHTSLPHDGQVSLGTEVNVLPAAIEAVRRTGGAVIAQANPRMPFTYGDGVIDRRRGRPARGGGRAARHP